MSVILMNPASARDSEAPAKVVINRSRMESALKGKRTKIPSGLSREEKRQFILNNG